MRTDRKDWYQQSLLWSEICVVLAVCPDAQLMTLTFLLEGSSANLLAAGIADPQLLWLKRFLEATGNAPDISLACLAENKVWRSRGSNELGKLGACPAIWRTKAGVTNWNWLYCLKDKMS